MALHLQSVPAGQGMVWVRKAFQLVLRRPFAFVAMFVAFLFAALFASVIPFVGMVAVMMALPLLTLGFMIASRSATRDGPVHPGQYLEPLRGDPQRRRELLVLCAVYAVATFFIIVASDAVDDGRFERLQQLMASGAGAADEAELQALLGEPELFWGMVVRFGLATLLSIPFWHAPALVWWGGQGAGQSLFSSTLACWRTRGALMVYVLAWVGLVGFFSALAGTVFALFGVRELAGIVALPAGLLFSCAFYASLYFTFSDTFASDQMIDTPLT